MEEICDKRKGKRRKEKCWKKKRKMRIYEMKRSKN